MGACEKVEVITTEANVVTSAVDAKPEPNMLNKVFEMLQKQQALIDDLSQKLSTSMLPSGARRAGNYKWEPRYDASGQPICFRCQKAGHIARVCQTSRVSRSQDKFPPALASESEGAAQISEQQGNYLPLR